MELTTGVVFLMSSLYGSGQANAQMTQIPATTQNQATSSVVTSVSTAVATTEGTFTDSKAIEAYVRKVDADEPLLIDIARCESTFRQFDKSGQVLRGVVNPGDVGVMQINEKYHADEAVKMGLNIYTVEGNVAFGRYLYDKYGAQPWGASSPCWDGQNDLARK